MAVSTCLLARLLLPLVLMAPLATSQDRVPPEARWKERLLTLQGGLVIRTEARLLDGAWERRDRKDRREVEALPDGVVISHRTLDHALDELRDRRRELRLAEGAERVPLADWMLETGLYTEALGELDKAFDEDPDCLAARELLSRDDLPLGLPAHKVDDIVSLAGLVDYGSRSPASLQEFVVIGLREVPLATQRELLPLLENGLSHESPVHRQFCARALRRLFPGVATNPLTVRAVVDRSPDVRREAALALADSGDEAVIEPLARALESSNSIVRTHAAEALGFAGFPAAVEPLSLRLASLAPGGSGGALAPRGTIFVGRQISYVQGFEAEVATNAVIADPLIGTVQEGAVLDAKVFGVSGPIGYEYGHETRSIRRALSGLTGQRVTDTNAAWKRWWKTDGAEWLAEHRWDRIDEDGEQEPVDG
jgi:hypothetical protein